MDSVQVHEEQAEFLSNTQVYGSLYVARLHSPQIASSLKPGQFVHMTIPGMPDKILRRPFSVYRIDRNQGTLDILYQVVGSGTQVLARVASGKTSSLLGPIGTTWQVPDNASVLLVGGGVGAAPLFLLAQQLSSAGKPPTVVLGAQTKDALVTYDAYTALDLELIAATDDGSFGFNGFCTIPAQKAIQSGKYSYVAVCGPEPVMKIVATAALDAGLACEVSLERRMACGVGACLSCVVDTAHGKKRCCVDGPIFNASEVVW